MDKANTAFITMMRDNLYIVSLIIEQGVSITMRKSKFKQKLRCFVLII